MRLEAENDKLTRQMKEMQRFMDETEEKSKWEIAAAKASV